MASLERHCISTGHLPAPEMVQSLAQDTHRRSKSNSDGKNSQAYPAMARVPSELFGACVAETSGRIYGAGDVDYEFSIMSVSKPFLFALICETIGPEEARAKLRANATGLPFNSLAKIAENAFLPKEIQAQVDLGNITRVGNEQLRSVTEKTTATPQQVQEALRVDTEARAACAEDRTVVPKRSPAAGSNPADQLPNYLPGAIPSDEPRATTRDRPDLACVFLRRAA
jgi:glutaminase